MRETKYRVWDKKLGMMAWEDIYNTPIKKLFENNIVMQSTGFKDKNEKEVYEGDIIKTKWKDVENEKWNKEEIKKCPELLPQYFHWYSELEDMNFEIIGNICDNPELLK